MKKLLNLLYTSILVSSSTILATSCKSDEFVIKYGIVDNGKDTLSKGEYKKMEDEFYRLYGKKFKLKQVVETGDDEGPKRVLEVGVNDGPDVYNSPVDLTAKLINANAILPLEGEDAPTGKNGVGKILTDLKYNIEDSKEVLDKFNKGENLDDMTLWSTWLPSSIEASKFINRNDSSKAKGKPYIYGITRTLGVGGGSSIYRIDLEDSIKATGWKDDPNIPGTSKNTVSFNDVMKASWGEKGNREGYKPNSNMPIMLERGMWEMYPIYSNIMSDDGEFKAAKIGMNWKNPNSEDPLHDDQVEVGKWSSVFTHNKFRKSAEEVIGKWFDIYSQSVKVAVKNLKGDKPEDKPKNLFDPTSGTSFDVKSNLMNNKYISASTAEPSNYADWSKANQGKGFANIAYKNLNSLTLFDEKDGKELYEKYENAKLNRWLTPSGSGQTVFSKKLANKPEKIKAAIRWVELLYGFKEDDKGEVVPFKNEESTKLNGDYGGVYNLESMYGIGSGVPSRLAIIKNSLIQDNEKFNKVLESKIKTKVDKAKGKYREYENYYKNHKEEEDKAIIRLEKFSVNLAAGLYKGENTLTVAPQVTGYDPATNDDHHGMKAMKPSLEEAFFNNTDSPRNDFNDIFGAFDKKLDINNEKYKKVKKVFIDSFLKKMKELNDQMNK